MLQVFLTKNSETMVEKRSTVNIVTLGCSKNKVDSEVLGAQLHAMGFEVVHDSEKKSNFVVINTCGFIGIDDNKI